MVVVVEKDIYCIDNTVLASTTYVLCHTDGYKGRETIMVII